MGSSRLYKSGQRWAVWRWTYTPSGYITRLHLVKTPFGALMVHFLNGPDPEPDLHDHPVTFLSCILSGGYWELRKRDRSTWYPPDKIYRWLFNFIRASIYDQHRIIWVAPHTVTFCIVGPKTRDWGFHTPDGWVYWKDYNEKYRNPEWKGGQP